MDQSFSHPQPTHPQNTHKTSRRRKRRVNEQEGLDSNTSNIRTGGSPTQAQVRHGQWLHTAILTTDAMGSNTMFQNAQGVNISGNPNFHNIGSVTNVYREGKDGLENLNGFVSFDAQIDSSAQDPTRRCHPGTRQNVLKRLRDWADNPKLTERIFWLYGPAGAGKSAIAQTIARSYSTPKIAGTFFFFRSDVNRNDGNRLFTTLAYQLALSMPGIREHIAHSLSKRPDLPRADIETQFKQLLARPFHALSKDVQRVAPAVHSISDIVKKYQELAPVIIIDGVDECTNETLQRQFLKVIGDAVRDNRFPLRFLIVSRPEVHIEQTIRRFQKPILRIDLAKLDDANRDIEKYLADEFARIASEQGLQQTWPGQEIIDDIIYKSSGNFIFASLVIRFVGDPYCFARTQLEIVLNMKPPTMSPFAILDQLFLEILGRVPDQDFLKRYLALLTARISAPNRHIDLYKDDAVLMHVSETELHANLRRMRSLLKFKPVIDVHHKSFLDFLHDSSRSGQYHIRNRSGIRGYLDVFVDSLVRYVSTVIEEPNPRLHNAPHFKPGFRTMIKYYPPKIKLPAGEWQEVMQPLLDLQDKLLQLPHFASPWDLLPCDQCTIVYLLRELLHIGLHLGLLPGTSAAEASTGILRKRRGDISSITDNAAKNKNDKDLDSILLSLFAHLPETLENWSPDKRVINLMSDVLCFDYAQTAMRVGSVSDAQKLVDLLDYVIHAKNVLHSNTRHKASLLALKLFDRVPIVPVSYFLNGNDRPIHYTLPGTKIHTEILSQTLFANRFLDHRYIKPALGTLGQNQLQDWTMNLWQRWSIYASVTRIQTMFWLAKAIQYLHSMGVVLDHQLHSHNVILDSDYHPKIRCWYSTSQPLLDKKCKERFLPQDNIFSFGGLCYELYAGTDTWPWPIGSRNRVLPERPSKTPQNVWQLIQRCCAEDPECRPTIDEVVNEIEGWHRVEEMIPREWTCFGVLTFVLSDLGRRLCQ